MSTINITQYNIKGWAFFPRHIDKITGLSVCILIVEIGILPQEFKEFRLSPEFVQN